MYWTKSPGTGGKVEREEDFVVEEIPLKKFLAKFSRDSSGVSPIKGPYSLVLLKKKGMTTKDVIDFISRKLSISKEDIGYAGLKDKFAVTSQYMTIKGAIDDIRTEKIELSRVGFTDKFMQVGELEGNRFAITLQDCKNPKNAERAVEEIKSRGMPNYFGPQRFGLHGNHLIGRLLLKRDFEKALGLINSQSKKQFRSVKSVDKRKLKFYIHAYQSFLFNSILDGYIKKNSKPFFGQFPIAGFGTKFGSAGKEMKRLLEEEKIKTEDFYLRELGFKATGSSRPAFVKIEKIPFEINGTTLRMNFELPKGSYATVIIGEIAKNPKSS